MLAQGQERAEGSLHHHQHCVLYGRPRWWSREKIIRFDNWNEKEDGQLDPPKVVEEEFFGQNMKGCWQLVGRQGVYTRTPISNKILESHTEVSDGVGPFAVSREKKIREVFSAGREQKSKKVLLYFS